MIPAVRAWSRLSIALYTFTLVANIGQPVYCRYHGRCPRSPPQEVGQIYNSEFFFICGSLALSLWDISFHQGNRTLLENNCIQHQLNSWLFSLHLSQEVHNLILGGIQSHLQQESMHFFLISSTARHRKRFNICASEAFIIAINQIIG